MNKYLDKRYKKIKELQEIIMRYEIDKGELILEKFIVQTYKDFEQHSLTHLNREEVFEYILMPISDINKKIPFDFHDNNNLPLREDDKDNFNRVFYNYINEINKTYEEKAKQELNSKTSESSRKWAIVAAIASILSIIISLLIAILK